MQKPKGLGAPPKTGRGSKIGVYGLEGSGKTEFLMSLTKLRHLLIADSEGRTQYYDPLKDFGFEVVYTNSPKEALEVLRYAEYLYGQGQNVAFGLDSFSGVWFEQQEVAERIGATAAGTAKFSSWGAAKKPLKQFYAALFSTPLDVVVTMRAKPAYEAEGNKVQNLGWDRPDVERGLPYALDLVMEMRKNELVPGKALKPEDFYARVTKTSGPKENNPLPIGTIIRDPNFAKVATLRIEGTGRLDFGDTVGLQVMQASITNSTELIAWATKNLGWSKDETVKHLEEKFGKLASQKLDQYSEWLYNQANSGQQAEELEAA